jgi:hypothetical protein
VTRLFPSRHTLGLRLAAHVFKIAAVITISSATTTGERPSEGPQQRYAAFATPVVVGIIDRAAARAAQILVRQGENVLIVGVAVDRVHRSANEAEVSRTTFTLGTR